MKTETSAEPIAATPDATAAQLDADQNPDVDAFYALLNKPPQPTLGTNEKAPKAEGIAMGMLVHVNADGRAIQVDIPSLSLAWFKNRPFWVTRSRSIIP